MRSHWCARFVAAAALLLSGTLHALTAGDLVLHSAPGAPLRAAIFLQLQPDESLATITARLADSDSYTAQNLQRPAIAEALRFALLARGEGRARLEPYSDTPWDGSDAALLLQLTWPQGTLQQQYALHWQATSAEQQYVSVRADDTLDRIAIRLSEGRNRSYLHMMYALYLANPESFYRGNMNNLKSGVTLRVPSDAELNRLQNREVFDTIREQYRLWQEGGGQDSAGSEAGRMLAGLSDAQAAGLDLGSGAERLRGQLASLVAQNQTIEDENAALRERLARLEQRMSKMSTRVLDLAATPLPVVSEGRVPAGEPLAVSASTESVDAMLPPVEAPVTKSVEDEPVTKAVVDEPATKPAAKEPVTKKESGGLPAPVLLLAILLVIAASYFIRRSAPAAIRRDD